MKRPQWGVGAIAVAVLVVGLVAGVPASTIFVGALVLACPVMMLLMHGGHGGGNDHGGSERSTSRPGTASETHDDNTPDRTAGV
jgi:hypothetical protein